MTTLLLAKNTLLKRSLKSLPLMLGALLMLGAITSKVHAYAWMVRHGYTSCATCHADPSGGSLLTMYGRAQGELLLRTHYSKKDSEDPGPAGKLLFGLIKTPEDVLLLGGDFRYFAYNVMPKTGPNKSDAFLMQSDIQGQLTLGRVRTNVSVGVAQNGATGAAITSQGEGNIVSRTHWVGVDLGEDREFLLRAGRINLPFGLRSIEHTAFVRSSTRTDINDAQSHGAALSYQSEQWRGEFMAMLGNYQISPDRFRERGYSGYIEYAPVSNAAVGLSSLVGVAGKDPRFQTSLTRQAHGLFARYSPTLPLVLMSEVDMLIDTLGDGNASGLTHRTGMAGMLQLDYELIQGLHLGGMGEMLKRSSDPGSTYGAWATLTWFFYSHVDFRFDTVYQSFYAGPTARTHAVSILGQFHFYL